MRTKTRQIWDEKNREERNKYFRIWRKKRGEKYREYHRIFAKKHRQKQRLKIIKAYGGKCACCGEWRTEFLAIDHINGGGAKERKIYKTCQMINKIIRADYPKKYQLLCHNCNQSRGYYGYCPHERKSNGN